MSFQLSPGVSWTEIDASTTIPAVATSIAVNVLRNSYKGPEFEQYFVSNVDQLISAFGKPTDSSYMDILACEGYLKYGKNLYCTRVMPDDATFAGVKVVTGYSTPTEVLPNFTFEVDGTVPGTEPDGPYTYTSLGTTDISLIPENVDTLMGTGEALWLMAKSRGEWGNNIRVIVFDGEVYNAIRYFDLVEKDVDVPYGLTISAAATAQALSMYNAYLANPDFGTVGYADNLGFNSIRELDTPMTSEKQFVILVQAKDQGSNLWEDVEVFTCSSDETEIDDNGQPLFVETVVGEQSNYIIATLNPAYKTTTDIDAPPIGVNMDKFAAFTGGKNGVWGRHANALAAVGENAACIRAYNLYSNPEEIDVNLFIDSGKNVDVKNHLIQLCEVTRNDCFTILDVPRALVLNNKGSEALDMVKWRNGQSGSVFNPNTSYAALYGNWIEIFDIYTKKYRWLPSSGHMAGLYAHTDKVADAWWAPAGLNRAILTGVRRLAFNPTEGERDIMYIAGINPIVSFAGQGKVVWGQKTLLDKQSSFNRVNVRRLFLVLEKSIAKSSKYFLFEQHDEITWMLMTAMIEPFLRDVKGRRGIYDYKVEINDRTNTPERIDRNELWGNIWIKATRSVEWIRLQFISTKTGASFDELIASGLGG